MSLAGGTGSVGVIEADKGGQEVLGGTCDAATISGSSTTHTQSTGVCSSVGHPGQLQRSGKKGVPILTMARSLLTVIKKEETDAGKLTTRPSTLVSRWPMSMPMPGPQAHGAIYTPGRCTPGAAQGSPRETPVGTDQQPCTAWWLEWSWLTGSTGHWPISVEPWGWLISWETPLTPAGTRPPPLFLNVPLVLWRPAWTTNVPRGTLVSTEAPQHC